MNLPLQPFLTSMVDYAGLFPPASQPLATAMTAYETYQQPDDSWLLGRFLLPVAVLPAFIKQCLQKAALSTGGSWPLSLLIHTPTPELLAALPHYSHHSRLSIAALEFSPQPPEAIAGIMARVPQGVDTFFEIPWTQSLDLYLPRLQTHQAWAKIRTGGTTAAAFPAVRPLAAFMAACGQARIPFKATAGLHHPFYGKYRLPGATQVQMHGFLNIAIAASLTWQYQLTTAEIIPLLQVTSLAGFAPWLETLNPDKLRRDLCLSRQQFFKGFGACSFRVPRDSLADLASGHDTSDNTSNNVERDLMIAPSELKVSLEFRR